jgi:site-specific recombinase
VIRHDLKRVRPSPWRCERHGLITDLAERLDITKRVKVLEARIRFLHRNMSPVAFRRLRRILEVWSAIRPAWCREVIA